MPANPRFCGVYTALLQALGFRGTNQLGPRERLDTCNVACQPSNGGCAMRTIYACQIESVGATSHACRCITWAGRRRAGGRGGEAGGEEMPQLYPHLFLGSLWQLWKTLPHTSHLIGGDESLGIFCKAWLS
jgi:hypothetical protein